MTYQVVGRCAESTLRASEYAGNRLDLDATVPEVLAPRMAAFADRVAISGNGRDVTYRDLDLRSNRIASHILECEPEGTAPIALMLDTGESYLAGALGAMKAGRPFVGLNARHPRERLRHILDDVEATIFLTDGGSAAMAHDTASGRAAVVDIDRLCPETGAAVPAIRTDPDEALLVTFTTGSTGVPKGVLNSHRASLWRTDVTIGTYEIGPGDRLAMIRPPETHTAFRMALCAWLTGATLCVWDTGEQGTSGLARWLVDQSITICPVPSNLFRRSLTTAPEVTEIPSVRVVCLTSDGANDTDVALWRRRFPNSTKLVHSISSSETGQFAHHEIDRSTTVPAGALPIGDAVPGATLALLDADGNEVAPGEVGEIAVTGRYLVPGYWRRPDLTRERFDGPDDPSALSRCRTGDLGRMAADGCLYYVGRNDDRARILGNRVELGEVEAALLALDGIEEAAAAVQDDPAASDGRRLVAYYVESGATQTPMIRAALGESLVRAMVPTRLYRVDAIPRGPTGKIDRAALQCLSPALRDQRPPVVAPGDALERALVAILEKQFATAPIGMNDDLFELGADSLTAIELFFTIERDLGLELPVETLWSRVQTVGDLARVLRDEPANLDLPQTAPRVGKVAPEPLFLARDIRQTGRLALILLIRHAIPPRHWRAATRLIARLVTRAYPGWTRRTERALITVLGDRHGASERRALCDDIQAANLENLVLSLGGWYPEAVEAVELHGIEHLERAIAVGKGALLLRGQLSAIAPALRAKLHRAGHTTYDIGRPEHGVSPSAFARRFLNRFFRDEYRAEDDRITILEDGQAAFDRVRRLLAENRIVAMSAGALADNPVDVPFIDNRLTLSPGPARLALATGATLLPVFGHRGADGVLHVTIEPPIDPGDAPDNAAAAERIIRGFAERLEECVERDPARWAAWHRTEARNSSEST